MMKLPSDFGRVVEELRRCTVLIAGRDGTGSGVIIDAGGVIVTNAHVVRSLTPEVQLWDGRSFPAVVSARTAERDLAVLSVPASGLPVSQWGDSDSVRTGDLVVAVGNPLGFIGAATTGIVHALGPARGLGDMNWVQSRLQLAPGNSGGPLADASGRVIGLNTMIMGPLAMALPANSIKGFIENEAKRERIGVVVHPVDVAVAGESRFGLAILQVVPGSPADRASLMSGDILMGVEGKEFRSIEDFHEALSGSGERLVRVLFFRGERSRIRKVSILLPGRRREAA